jgi:hypothetical protein
VVLKVTSPKLATLTVPAAEPVGVIVTVQCSDRQLSLDTGVRGTSRRRDGDPAIVTPKASLLRDCGSGC